MSLFNVFAISFLLVSSLFFLTKGQANMRDSRCKKKEDRICPKRALSLCRLENFRFQCPRKCGECVDRDTVNNQPVVLDTVRSAVSSIVNDIIGNTNTTAKPKNRKKFNQVMKTVERSIGQAQLRRKTFKLTDLKKDIKQALDKDNVRFARFTLGLALYDVTKTKPRTSKSGRRKRSATDEAKKLLASIKNDVGEEKFSKLFALDGEVTLMFAIDITGSMREEIDASKAIATEISKLNRTGRVNYILTSFGDPIAQGTSIVVPDGGKEEFIRRIGDLTHMGGGDCAEYAYEGILRTLDEDPKQESPLYVFTDAPPKDATDENLEAIKELAEAFETTIYFFAHKSCTQGPYTFKHFQDLTAINDGQFFKIKENEIEKMATFTGNTLDGLSTAASGGTIRLKKRKRSTHTQIAIPVDDTVTKLIVTVTTANSPDGVSLIMPNGVTWTAGSTRLSNVVLYDINSPDNGVWKLSIPSSVGEYEYSAKVNSPENIDFKHHYTKYANKKFVQVRSPLAGEFSYVDLTLSRAPKIQVSSLRVDIIDISGTVLIPNKKLTPKGTSGERFSFSFPPPSKPFKLLLKGKTNTNKTFQRISQHVNEAKTLVLKEFYNSKRDTLKRGGRTLIMLYLFNSSDKEQSFNIIFKDTLGYKISLLGRKVVKIRERSKKFLRVSVRYNGGKLGEVGQTENIIIIVKGTGVITSELVSLMMVD